MEFSVFPLLLSKKCIPFSFKVNSDSKMCDFRLCHLIILCYFIYDHQVKTDTFIFHLLHFLSGHPTSNPRGKDIFKANPVSILYAKKTTRYSSMY